LLELVARLAVVLRFLAGAAARFFVARLRLAGAVRGAPII
jgi:hypothetical protein